MALAGLLFANPCSKSIALISNNTQRLIEAIDQEVGVVFRQAHRRLDAKYVAVQSAFADQESMLFAAFEQRGRFSVGRLLRHSVANQLDAQHQAHPADFAY